MTARLVALACALTLLAGSHWYVFNAGKRVERAEWVTAQAKADAAATAKYNAIAEELEYVKGQRITVQRTITRYRDKIIDRPVYRNACLDDDGRMLINAAIRGADPGKPAAAVPAVK